MGIHEALLPTTKPNNLLIKAISGVVGIQSDKAYLHLL